MMGKSKHYGITLRAWYLKNKSIKEKWETAVRSSQIEWVDYNQELNSRSRVNFKQGKILFEVVISEFETDRLKKAKKLLMELGLSIFEVKAYSDFKLLEGQIQNKS